VAYLRNASSSLAILASLLLCTGCIHKTPTLGETCTLEEKSGYSLLVPSLSSQTSDADFQTSMISLPRDQWAGITTSRQDCVIHGPVFSLDPGGPGKSSQWIIKSLSPQGWPKRAGELDIHAEWNHFLRDLLELERQSCFPRKESFYTMRRAIAEKIPLPANEAAFFSYSFGGSGFVDLAPGMQIKIERPLVQSATSTTRAAYKGSLEADYRVTSPSSIGAALVLSRTANRRAATSLGAEANLIFELSNRFAPKPLLRLFLQSIGEGKAQPAAILLGASGVHDLEEATRRVEENGHTSCPQPSSPAVECICFGTETAVSLLSSVQINGKTELRPFGTTVGYMIDVRFSTPGPPNKDLLDHDLQTVTLSRPMVTGGYAEVKFPRTMDSVSQIVLLPGDRLAWKQ